MKTPFYLFYKTVVFAVFTAGFIIGCTTKVKAQLNPLASQYFQNQYLFNPAMAGIDKGFNLNLAYSKQGIGVDGAQSNQALSAEYQFNKVGLGINLVNGYSGLFRTTSALITYAYHLPIGDNNQKLNFGLSGGIVNQHIQTADVIGDESDQVLARYNQKQNYADGNFGISYTDNKLTIQASLPDLKTLFDDNNTFEREKLFTSVSYNFIDAGNIGLEPKVAFREVQGFSNVVDAGLNLSFSQNAFSIQGIYHSSNSATFGFGVNRGTYSVAAFYTTNTGPLASYNNGDAEVSLKINLPGK